MAYFNCLNSVKAGLNPLNSSNSRSWIFSSLHRFFSFRSWMLFALSHTPQSTPWENMYQQVSFLARGKADVTLTMALL